VARRQKVELTDSTVTAKVGLGTTVSRGFELAVTLAGDIPGVERATAQQLTERAHQVCPYSNATRGNSDVALEVA
jgi:osmotically inducible protein OsmC